MFAGMAGAHTRPYAVDVRMLASKTVEYILIANEEVLWLYEMVLFENLFVDIEIFVVCRV